MPEIDLVGIAAATTIDSAHVVDGGLVVRCDRCRAEIVSATSRAETLCTHWRSRPEATSPLALSR
jgi:hypothetical protein